MTILYYTIKTLGDLLVLLVIISAILSFVMDPYHPVRRWIEVERSSFRDGHTADGN